MKECCACRQIKPLEEFYKHKWSKDGYQGRCRSCHKEWYETYRATHPRKIYATEIAHRQRNYEYVQDYLKTHPCIDCGESDPIVLEFDHVRGEKRCNISNMAGNAYSFESLVTEIEKCDVRCANCHRRKTVIELGWHTRYDNV